MAKKSAKSSKKLATKKRNPQDATLRNVRSATSRIAKLELLVKKLTDRANTFDSPADLRDDIDDLQNDLAKMEREHTALAARVKKLEPKPKPSDPTAASQLPDPNAPEPSLGDA